MNNLHNLLTNHTCQDLIKTKVPIYVHDTTSIKEACQTLHQNSISSVPILSKSGFTAQIEYFDLVRHVLDVLATVPQDTRSIQEILSGISSAATVAQTEKHRPIVLVQKEVLLLDVVHEFVRSKAHRVVVLDQTQFIGVVSQSAVASLIVDNFGLRGKLEWNLGQQTLESLGVIHQRVVTVTENNTVMDALFSMYLNNISSIAIVRQLNLRGAISMSDVKMILEEPNGWKKVFQTCGAFFKDLRIAQRYFILI
jgi:CBS domain-containing protein